MAESRNRRRIAAVAAAIAMLIGLLQWKLAPGPEPWDWRTRLYGAQWRAFVELGALALLLCGFDWAMDRLFREGWARWRWRLAGAGLTLLVFGIACAEFALREASPNGALVGRGNGAMARDYESWASPNGLLPRSRGPADAVEPLSKEPRLLVQGGAVTAGWSIPNAEALYTSHVRRNLGGSMAVVAQPGLQMDDHLRTLRSIGPRARPSLIVYQWSPSDCELGCKAARPSARRPWEALFWHELAIGSSYLWCTVDAKLLARTAPPRSAYIDYLNRELAPDGEPWALFESAFDTWAAEALQQSPRVLVVFLPTEPGLEFLRERVELLCMRVGVDATDASELWDGRTADRDGHVALAVHLMDEIGRRWPELLED